MAQPGKASIKRSKPSYFMAILGVTLVLFFIGIIGYLVIVANKAGDKFKENVIVNVYLRGDLNRKDSAALMEYISSKPYASKPVYTTKEMAKAKFTADNPGEDWQKMVEYNPLPASIDFGLKKNYVNPDSLKVIKADLSKQTYVDEIYYQEALVSKLNNNVRRISIGLLVLALILGLVAILLIDNTIKLAMFSNRFLIKTMQMVGATRWFIAKPMNIKAIINGATSGIIAAMLVWLLVYFSERKIFQDMVSIRNDSSIVLLFLVLIILGILITLISTHRSVVKYLKMRLDDLY